MSEGRSSVTARRRRGGDEIRSGGRRARGRGQALVEFALILPVFFLLFAGMVDFGIALYSDITVINAAREGARIGVVDPGDVATIRSRVRSMSSNLEQARLKVTVTCERPEGITFVACSSPAWQSGDSTVVRVDYRYSMIFPLLFGTEVPLTSEVRMRIE